MIEINIKQLPHDKKSMFEVQVKQGSTSTEHLVGVPEDFYQRLTKGKITKEQCVKSAFRFLLDREPKESILAQFDLPVIGRYFPEFEEEFEQYTK